MTLSEMEARLSQGAYVRHIYCVKSYFFYEGLADQYLTGFSVFLIATDNGVSTESSHACPIAA